MPVLFGPYQRDQQDTFLAVWRFHNPAPETSDSLMRDKFFH
jgi:hypothetical protein